MYWLLLPVDANAQRHLADEAGHPGGFWTMLWAKLQDAVAGVKSPDA
jgi:hypothetical protein